MTEEPKEQPKLNLYQKISAVMQEVDYLQKDGHISFKSTNYKAISEEKVTTTVRAALIKYGLVILPFEQEHSREGTLSTVDTKYKIVDIDTGSFEVIVSSGTGADTQDKGVGKAMTYSYKYLLLRTFAIPTGEDPDKTSSAELDAKDNGESPPPSNVKSISQKQVGLIKVQVKKLASLKTKTDEEVYEYLKVQDVTKLTSHQASKAIETLKKWVEQAELEKGA